MLPGTKVKRWSADDISYLNNNFLTTTDSQMAVVLGRSPEAVQTKRNELKLIKPVSFSTTHSVATQYKKGNVPVITPHHLKKKRTYAWTDDQVAFLVANWETMTSQQVADAIGRTRSATTSKALELGIKKSEEAAAAIRRRLIGNIVRKDGWTNEQVEYLKANWATHSNAEIAAAIGRSVGACKKKSQEFGLITSKETISRLCKKPNAGQYAASKVGDIVTRTNAKGVKTLWIKLADKQWQQLHRYNWLKAGNALPDGHNIRFIDGDSSNCAIENLMLSKTGRFSTRDIEAEKAAKQAQRMVKREQKLKLAAQSKATKKQERLLKAELRLAVAARRIADSKALRLQLKNERQKSLDLEREAKRAARHNLSNELRENKKAEQELRRAEKLAARPVKAEKSAKSEIQKTKSVKAERLPKLKIKKLPVLEDPARIKARETKRLVKAKIKAVQLHKEIQAQKAADEKSVFKTREIDYSDLITVRIDAKTVIQVKRGTDIEAIKAKYIKKPKEDWTNMYGHVPPQYEF